MTNATGSSEKSHPENFRGYRSEESRITPPTPPIHHGRLCADLS